MLAIHSSGHPIVNNQEDTYSILSCTYLTAHYTLFVPIPRSLAEQIVYYDSASKCLILNLLPPHLLVLLPADIFLYQIEVSEPFARNSL